MNIRRISHAPLWLLLVTLLSGCSLTSGTVLNWIPSLELPSEKPASLAAEDNQTSPAQAPHAMAPSEITPVAIVPTPLPEVHAGTEVQLVTLRSLGAADMQRLLAQISPKADIKIAPAERNALLIAGGDTERQFLLQTISSFDVDWLAHARFEILPMLEADANGISHQLWDILGTPRGPFGTYVRIVPLDHLNSIFIASRQPHYMELLKAWVKKLDVASGPNERKIWVYHVQNTRASSLKDPLQKIIATASPKPDDSLDHFFVTEKPSPRHRFRLKDGSDAGDIPPPPTPATLKQQMSELDLKNSPHASVDDTTNTIIVWANKVEFILIRDGLKKLDPSPERVHIDAVIAEVTLSNDLAFGVQNYVHVHNPESIVAHAEAPGSRVSAFVMGLGSKDFLNQLKGVTGVRVLSSPQFTAFNHQSAEIRVGTILKATPRITAGAVTLDIATDGNTLIANALPVHEGETIVLGGITRDSVSETKSHPTIVENIPYLEDVFTETLKTSTRTETVVFLAPHIVKDDDDTFATGNDLRLKMSDVTPLESAPHP